MKINCELPTIFYCSDYHEFDWIQITLTKLNKKLKCKEIGLTNKDYVGIVYYDKLGIKENKIIKEVQDKIYQENKD